jgi:hypothetical protein
LPLKKVWKFPKLEPVGVLKLVDPKPVNVIMSALPMPPKKVTEFVPLPAQPAHVNVPLVLKVTGSALAVPAAIDKKPVTITSIKEAFRKILMISVLPNYPCMVNLRSCSTLRIAGGDCFVIESPEGNSGIPDLR